MPTARLSATAPLAALAVAALLAAGCSSSGGSKPSTPSTSASGSSTASGSAASATPTPTSPPSGSADASSSAPASSPKLTNGASGSPADVARLRAISVRASDLPAGFTASPPDPSSDDDTALASRLAACTGEPGAPESDTVAVVESDDFVRGQVTVSSSFSQYRSQADIQADVAQARSPKFTTCITQLFKTEIGSSLDQGTTISGISFTVSPPPKGAPSNVVVQGKGVVSIAGGSTTQKIYIGVALVTGPSLEGSISYIGQGSAVDDTTAGRAVALVAERAAKG